MVFGSRSRMHLPTGRQPRVRASGLPTQEPSKGAPDMTRFPLILAAGLALAGCATGQQALTDAGVAPDKAIRISADVAAAGQLFCQAGPLLLAVTGVNVKGASADTVAKACAVAQAVGALTPPATPPVPVAAPAGAVAVVAKVPDSAAAAVKFSAGGKQ